MANIPIRDIPGAVQTAPSPNALLAMDNGTSMEKTTVQAITDSGAPVASKSEAEVGTDNTKRMTALRVKESIAAEVGQTIASSEQGSKADSAVQPSRTISAGTGLVGGGDLSADRSFALSTTALASLALADTAVQPARAITAGTGLTGGGNLSADRTISLSTATHASLALADSAVQPTITISAGTGLTGGGTLAANRTIALSSASIASLALADTAVQPSRTISAGTGLTGGGDLSANRTIALDASSIASLALADSAIQPGDAELLPAGGSTGQVLAKATNDDYDTEWVTSEAATAVSYGPQSLNAAQQGQARANIGAGILSGFRNKIINGAMEIAQRGTSFAASASSRYTLDRWRQEASGTTLAINRTALGVGTTEVLGGNVTYCMQATTVAGAGESDYARITQRIEDVKTLSGKKVTVAFWARANTTGSIAVSMTQNFGTGGSETASTGNVAKFALTSNWTLCTATVDLPSVSGNTVGDNNFLGLHIWFDAGSTHNGQTNSLGHQSTTLFLTKVCVMEGDATAEADPFEYRPIGIELVLCERYLQLSRMWPFVWYTALNPANGTCGVALPTVMRAPPTLTAVGTPAVLEPGTTSRNVAGITTALLSERGGQLDLTTQTPNAAFRTGFLQPGSYRIDAEL